MSTITVEVSAAGTVKIDAEGFTGTGCAAATEQIEIALGGGASKKRKEKPEFYAPASAGQVDQHRKF